MDRYQDKVVVVTGAGGGIGEGYAKGFALEGASVVVVDIDAEGAKRVAADIEKNGNGALAVECDVTDEEATKRMAQAANDRFGGVDVLINNAGLFRGMEHHSLMDIPIGYWNKFFDVSMTGALLCSRAVVESMAARGGGSIINQSSTGAYMGAGAYGTAKLAVHSLTHSLARELGPRGIRVNAIAPGPTDTAAMRELPDGVIEGIKATLSISRLGTVDDHAEAAMFLASDAATWITGVILNVDGGHMMQV
jgi:3-oxoacyl-[acyl-carrier protein] reductase